MDILEVDLKLLGPFPSIQVEAIPNFEAAWVRRRDLQIFE